MIKLEGTYYFKPLDFYNFLQTDPEESRRVLGDSMFFNLLETVNFPSKSNNVFYVYQEREYVLSNYNLMCYLNNIVKYVSERKDNVSIKEKVEVFIEVDRYKKETLKMKLRNTDYIISEGFVTSFLERPKEYKDVTYNKMLINSGIVSDNSLSIRDEETLGDVELSLDMTKQEIKEKEELLKKEIEDLKKAQELELEKVKQAFALKISKAKLNIAEKMTPLITEIETLTDKFTVMESNLYRWLSYNGQSYELKKLSEGLPGDKNEKLIIWQKLRYLDEELPKLVLSEEVDHNVSFNEFASLENLMTKYKVIRDFFIPSEKGCIVFQLSRNSVKTFNYKTIEVSKTDPHHPWIEYVKQSYEVENWNKLGMFIKNGENLYVLWLDTDRINITSDNLFLSKNSEEVTNINYSSVTEVEDVPEYKQGETALNNIETIKGNYEKRRKTYAKFNSRVYIVDILQGLIDNYPEVLSLGESQDVIKALSSGSYGNIVFNNADGYLSYKKWESVKEILEEIKDEYRIGDPIYMLSGITGKDRGRINNYNYNYTNDASVGKGLNKINLIDYVDTYYWTKEVTEDMLEFKNERYQLKDEYYHCSIFTKYTEVDKYYFSNYVKDYKTIEGWLTSYDGGPAIVYYKLDITSETKRKEHPYVSRSKMIRLSEHKYDGVFGSLGVRMYMAIDSYYRPNLYRGNLVGKQTLEDIQKRYKGIHKGEDGSYYAPYEYNKLYERVEEDSIITKLMSLGLKYNEDMYKRTEYLYVSGKKSWSNSGRANIMIYDDEFIPLKNLTLEHVNYMISNSMSLPGLGSYSNSVRHLLEIRKWVIERDKNKKK